MWSRSSRSASPSSRSDAPNPYAWAVSKRLIPTSRAWRIAAMASSRSKSPHSPPICHVPKAILDTSSSVIPSRVVSMSGLLGSSRHDRPLQILQYRHRRTAPVERDHRSGRVRRRPAQIEPVDRSAPLEPAVPHLVGHRLALEDAAAAQPDPRLDVGRAEHLDVLDALAHVGGVGADRVENQAADLVAAPLPVPVGELVRRVLAEGAHRVAAGRGDRGVIRGLEVQLAEPDPRLASGAGLEPLLRGVDPALDRDHRPVRLDLAGGGGTPRPP